jgi:transposase
MSRPRQLLDRRKEGHLVLEQLTREPAGWRKERLLAVKLGLEGELDLEAIANAVGRARSSIQSWFDAFREGGLAKLLELHRGQGPASRLGAQHAAKLQAGLARGQWRTAPDIQRALAEDGLQVSLTTVYKYLGKCGARLRVPRPQHSKNDPAAAEAFKSSLAEKLHALQIEPGREVRLWVMDEMRCGLHTETRRVWGLPNMRPVVRVQQKYQWQYVYGALEVSGGAAHFWYAPTVDLECNQKFLADLAAADPERTHVIIYDGAGFHQHDGDAALPAHVRIITLPPYSPELNPVEKLWDVLRDSICNRVFGTIEQLQRALSPKLKEYWDDTANVLSLLGEGWMLAQANASGPSILPE